MTDSTVELKCADYQVSAASMGHTRAGAVFRCTVSPVSNATIEELAAAARAKEMIRLIFPKEPLLLERVDVKRIDAGTVRIVGRIVSP
jgi:hypothetical protein